MENEVKAPSDKPEFLYYWDLYIEDVTARENFKDGHLEQLRILCQMFTEFDKLTEEIEDRGFTYETDPKGESRYGSQIKVNPACTLRDKTLLEIRSFSKLLGLVLDKDLEKKPPKENVNEWSKV